MPFAKKFLDKTEIIESEDIEEDAIKCLESEERPMLWLTGYPKKFNRLVNFSLEKHKDKAAEKDLWMIWDHPNQVNKIGSLKQTIKNTVYY